MGETPKQGVSTESIPAQPILEQPFTTRIDRDHALIALKTLIDAGYGNLTIIQVHQAINKSRIPHQAKNAPVVPQLEIVPIAQPTNLTATTGEVLLDRSSATTPKRTSTYKPTPSADSRRDLSGVVGKNTHRPTNPIQPSEPFVERSRRTLTPAGYSPLPKRDLEDTKHFRRPPVRPMGSEPIARVTKRDPNSTPFPPIDPETLI